MKNTLWNVGGLLIGVAIAIVSWAIDPERNITDLRDINFFSVSLWGAVLAVLSQAFNKSFRDARDKDKNGG
jgi:hypothetical protein